MARKTPVDKLNTAISKILTDYAGNIGQNVDEIAVEMGKRGAQALREKSRATFPVRPGRKITGDYARGWSCQKNGDRLSTTVTIFNEHPALPHLLEYGHVTRNGTGRTFPRTPAHEHIKPVADELVSTFEREVLGKL